MAHHHPSRLDNRPRTKAEKFLAGGARCELPAEVVEVPDVICTMLGFPREGHDVFWGSNGSVSHARAGHVLVDMTTMSPSLARRIDRAVHAKSGYSVPQSSVETLERGTRFLRSWVERCISLHGDKPALGAAGKNG